MRNLAAVFLVGGSIALARVSLAQPQTAQPNAKAAASTQNLPPSKGFIEQGTYKNASIGLEFTPAENLHLQEPEIRAKPGTVDSNITVSALADTGLFSGFSARSLTTFYADLLARYPERSRNSASYMKMVTRAQEADGFQHVGSVASDQMSGISFVRSDFTRRKVYEAVLVTTHNSYAFVFIFAGSSVEVTNTLIASTKVKFAP